MEGHIAKLPEFIQLAEEFKAFVVMTTLMASGFLETKVEEQPITLE